jgi:hypothetical protein
MRYLTLFLLLICTVASAQKKSPKVIDEFITQQRIQSHLLFLAADEMRGRNTGSPELDITANYIMTQFMAAGVLPGDGKSFFQPVSLMRVPTPARVELALNVGGGSGTIDGLLLEGRSAQLTRPVIFAGYGTSADLDKVDVNGRIVVCLFGSEGATKVGEAMSATGPAKRRLVAERGAQALVEIMAMPNIPWSMMQNYISRRRIALQKDDSGIPHLLIENSGSELLRSLQDQRSGSGSLSVEVALPTPIPAKNVVGVIRGTDPALRDEYVALTAHYDHVGVNKQAGQDSIFNGARDNAIGVTALLETASFFSRNPTKRSILLIALTAEEVGLLGSKWYAEHPVIPLKQTVFDINCDGAGYNDTSIATVIDFNRTTADELLRQACTAAGLQLKGDPAPEQGLYDRSDNVAFARQGVPAVNFSPGVKAFDKDLMLYYHQPADEVGTLDMAYLAKFYRAMLRSVYALGNAAVAPTWKSGDKYEAAGKTLYVK